MRLLTLIYISIFTFNAAAEPFIINVIESYQGHTEQKKLESTFNELYASLNITPKFLYYPSKRGLRLVNKGIIDAEAGRFELTAKHYPNLVKVDEPLDIFHSGFYCLTEENCRVSQDTNIVAFSSFQSARTFCASMQLRCSFESEIIAIVRMLEEGIAQGFLSSTMESNKVLCAIKATKLYFHNKPALARLSYHFVHKRHALLVPELEDSMKKLKQQGVLPNTKLHTTPTHSACGKHIISV